MTTTFSKNQIEDALRLYAAGQSIKTICDELNISSDLFHSWLKQYPVPQTATHKNSEQPTHSDTETASADNSVIYFPPDLSEPERNSRSEK